MHSAMQSFSTEIFIFFSDLFHFELMKQIYI